MQKRTVAAFAALCAMTMTLEGCGMGDGAHHAEQNDAKDIITAFGLEPANPLVPGDTNEVGGSRATDLLYTGLVSFDAKGDVRNDDAQSITPDAAGTTYTVKLRKGLKFSDGSPITASSYTRAWSYTANVKNAQKKASMFVLVKGYDSLQNAKNLKGDEQLSGLKVVDSRTFTAQLTSPDVTFPVKLGSFPPLPDAYFKNPKAVGQKPVGNGPYKLVSWNHNSSIETVRNPYYTGPSKPKNDGITLKIYTKDDAAYSDVQAGNLDVMDSIPSSETKSFRKDPSLVVYDKPGSRNEMFAIPVGLEHFRTDTQEGVLRREAISTAIDRKALVSKVMNGSGVPATDFTAPAIPGYTKDLKGEENVTYNPKRARELWAKADAISKDTDKLTFSYNADTGNRALYEAIVNSVNNVLGQVASPVAVPTFSELRTDISEGKMTGAFRSGWSPDYPSAESYLYQNFSSQAADGGSNDSNYKNPKFDELMNQAYAAKSIDEANGIYAKSQEMLLNDLPCVPLFYSNNSGVAAKGVKGFVIGWNKMPFYTQVTKE